MWLQVYGDDHVWVSTRHPAQNYTTANMAQLLIDAGGRNASKLYHILQANSTPNPINQPTCLCRILTIATNE